MISVFNIKGLTAPWTFIGHRNKVLKTFMSPEMELVYTLCKDGMLFIWEWKEDVITQEYSNERAFLNIKTGKKLLKTNNSEFKVLE